MLLEISAGCHTFESLINLFIMASHYRARGSPEKAVEALQNVLGEAYSILDKEEHQNLIISARLCLGRCYLRKLDKAFSVREPTLKQARQLWGGWEAQTTEYIESLASVYVSLDCHRAAFPLAEEVPSRRKAAVGERPWIPILNSPCAE